LLSGGEAGVWGVAEFWPGKKRSISPAKFCQDSPFYAL
jgi:hypothetical protein